MKERKNFVQTNSDNPPTHNNCQDFELTKKKDLKIKSSEYNNQQNTPINTQCLNI